MTTPSPLGAFKVFWTPTEKELIVREAVRLHHERPDLAGLPLVRAAQKALPPERRRKLVAVDQVPWFDGSFTAAMRASAAAAAPKVVASKLVGHPDDPYLPVMRAYVDELRAARDVMALVAEAQALQVETSSQIRASCSDCLGLRQQTVTLLGRIVEDNRTTLELLAQILEALK